MTMLSHADLVEIYLNLQLGTPLYIQGSLNSTSSYPERKPASEPKNGPSQTAPLAIDSLHDTSLPCHSLENYNEIISINISSRSIIKFFFLLFRVRNLFWLIFGYARADKPGIADLQYFLDFQSHKFWAPIHNDLPLGPATNRPSTPFSSTLHFNLMGPKLFLNPTPVRTPFFHHLHLYFLFFFLLPKSKYWHAVTQQVTVGKRPVTGMRLYLEGMKCNR